jgi:hypothetical protein
MDTRTASLPAGAFAVAHGQPLPRLESISPNHFGLLFDDPDGQALKLIDNYFHGAAVPARDFYAALRDLRLAINRAKAGAL